MLEAVMQRILRAVFGGGADISAANPLPVDTSPGVKTAITILDEAIILAGATTGLGDCISIDLSGGPDTLALTVEATYAALATLGIRIHVRTSYNDADWDTEDWDVWNPAFVAGVPIRQTRHYDTSPMYVRVLVENLDLAEDVADVLIIATVGV